MRNAKCDTGINFPYERRSFFCSKEDLAGKKITAQCFAKAEWEKFFPVSVESAGDKYPLFPPEKKQNLVSV